MTRLLEILEKLTEAERREVEDFAEFLLVKRATRNRQEPPKEQPIRYGSWIGCLAHIDPNKSDKEVIREAWDEVIDKLEKE